MKQFHLHLISDSTGETVSSVARAALVQFEGVEAEEHIWSLVRTPQALERVIEAIALEPGPVMFTLVDPGLRDQLKRECMKRSLPCIPVLHSIVAELSNYLGQESHAQVGKQHQLDEEYFTRVDAINYMLAHDDGQAHWELDDADIVLVGVSRTSKSPTCVYLAYKGYKCANVPFVPGIPLPESLEQIKKPLVIGLTINMDRLLQIRKTRLQSLGHESGTDYIDTEKIQHEIQESKKYFAQRRWPVIDVTRRSVEETAATIIQHFQRHQEQRDHGESS